MGHPQDCLQDVGQVSPPLMASKVQDHMSHLPPAEAGLPQEGLLTLNSMDLAQENLLALVNVDLGKVDLGKVDLLIVDKVVLSLDSHDAVNSMDVLVSLLDMVKKNMAQVSLPALLSMALSMVSLPALAHITQGHSSLPKSGDMVLVQDSLLVWINMDQHQDNILDPLHRVLDKAVPQGVDTVVHPQDSLQDVGQVSPPLMANKVQDHMSHLPPGEAGLPLTLIHIRRCRRLNRSRSRWSPYH